MATSQTEPAAAAAPVRGDGDTTSSTTETIAGWHLMKIDCFSATKDLGVGKSIKSDTFRVGGHEWYVECCPCGDVEERAGWVTIGLRCHDNHPSNVYRVKTQCEFTLTEPLKDGGFKQLAGTLIMSVIFHVDNHDKPSAAFIQRKRLESLLKDDLFQVRCVVLIEKLPAVAQPDLDTDIMSWSHMLTVNGYTKSSRELAFRNIIRSSTLRFGGHDWCIEFYLWGDGEDGNDADGITTSIYLKDYDDDDVKVRFEMTLLNRAGHKISSIQDFYTFSETSEICLCKFLSRMEHESSSLLQDGIQIRYDMAVVNGIMEVQPPPETDVTFEVGGELFSAHKNVLAARSTVFMAEFFGPAGKDNAGVTQVLRIDDMEPRVFKALRHFIYTDALPEVREEDKVVLAQGLLVAADRYAMERLKLICGDLLCCYIDATTAVTTLKLAEKHGCLKLKKACIKVVRDWLANVTP